VIPVLDVELAHAAAAELGEGPIWDARSQCLYFVDIMRGRVHRFAPGDASTRVYQIDRAVGAVGLTERGDLLLAVRDGFARLDPSSSAVTTIATIDQPADCRMNDGACDPAGRFWAGTMAIDERPDAGALYRLDPDGRVDTILEPVTISNGIDWSADGRRMFFIDSVSQRIDVLDFDCASGTVSERRPFVSIPVDAGVPDGLTIDAEDHVWVTLWRGGAVRRYTPEGALDRVVRMPATHPTSCAFGGDDLRDLYITTATIALDATARARQPEAGGLFRCRPGMAGRLPHRFGG
jgi:sugar lactone lactonase YvrE